MDKRAWDFSLPLRQREILMTDLGLCLAPTNLPLNPQNFKDTQISEICKLSRLVSTDPLFTHCLRKSMKKAANLMLTA